MHDQHRVIAVATRCLDGQRVDPGGPGRRPYGAIAGVRAGVLTAQVIPAIKDSEVRASPDRSRTSTRSQCSA